MSTFERLVLRGIHLLIRLQYTSPFKYGTPEDLAYNRAKGEAIKAWEKDAEVTPHIFGED